MRSVWAILLLKLSDQDVEPFSTEEAELRFTRSGKGTNNLVDYYMDMSHGRLDLSNNKVFGWLSSTHSQAERAELYAIYQKEDSENQTNIANNRIRSDEISWGLEAASSLGIDVSEFDGVVIIYSGLFDYFAQIGRVVLQFNAGDPTMFSIDLTGVAHELGHGLGLGHSRTEGKSDEYGDPWDIMSAYNVRTVANGVRYDRFGPGLNAANMAIAKWLDERRVWQPPADGEHIVTLRPLHRRDLDGYLVALIEDIYVEFRMNEGWDLGIEEPMVLLHRKGVRPNTLEPCSYLLENYNGNNQRESWLKSGDTYGDVGGRFSRKPMIEVLRIDPETREATLLLRSGYRKSPLDGLEFVASFFGSIRGDGGFLWHPRKGPVPIPPRSPMLQIMDKIASIEALKTVGLEPAVEQPAMRQILVEMQSEIASMIASLDAPRV
ncbi:MAG: hypothetical protein ACK5CA_04030 [Cyanobacteriota bacterium]|jgi:hypothetical protein